MASNDPPDHGSAGGEQASLSPLRDDGLPTLDTGEPVLHRWFVIGMLVLVPVALAVSLWAILAIPSDTVPPAQRRPPGDAQVTIDRGDAQLGESTETEAGPRCAEPIELVGDSGSRAAARRALGAACQLLASGRYPAAEAGLDAWTAARGQLRFATFARSVVESSSRVEDGRIVVELNAKFLFEDATRATPAVLHQLVLIGAGSWPGSPVTATLELEAARLQADACARMVFAEQPPRGCQDVDELLAENDPLGALVDAGYPAS